MFYGVLWEVSLQKKKTQAKVSETVERISRVDQDRVSESDHISGKEAEMKGQANGKRELDLVSLGKYNPQKAIDK